MNDEQIVEYCRKLVKANLNQYIDVGDTKLLITEIYFLENDKDNSRLYNHCKGLLELLNRCVEILENDRDK